jgi:hypothetical protein
MKGLIIIKNIPGIMNIINLWNCLIILIYYFNFIIKIQKVLLLSMYFYNNPNLINHRIHSHISK